MGLIRQIEAALRRLGAAVEILGAALQREPAPPATPPLLTDATVCAVRIGGGWMSIDPGSWSVRAGGPLSRVTWTCGGARFTAFLGQVQVVRHLNDGERVE